MDEVIYRIDGMTCGGCVSSVKQALERLGRVEVRVSLADATASVAGDAKDADVQRVVEAAGFGFGGRVPGASEDGAGG